MIVKIFLPMMIFFLFQLLFIRLLCNIYFVDRTTLFSLRNLRLYYTFSYFTFFFDCFLGFFMCLTRIIKAFLCALIFFARLDYSPYGRGFEMYDASYASYVSYFHMEHNQRHPVANVFLDIIRQRLISIRKLQLKLSSEQTCLTYEQERRSRLRRFRWALAYTLINNESLKYARKHRCSSIKVMPSKTLERIFKKISSPSISTRKF
jgi:hypothetical protein